MSRIILKALNGIFGCVLGIVLMASCVYAGYSLWDNYALYQNTRKVQNEVRQLKPEEDTAAGPGFNELKALNGDVAGWICVDGTNIAYPVLQGETNLTYMNQDVYGGFSLAGSIFLDTRNARDFSDAYTLIYGHNMDEHLMFGDLALFKEREFFEKNTTATLLLPGERRHFKVAAVLQLPAGTEEIFDPDCWGSKLAGFGEFLEKNSVWYHTDLMQQLCKAPEDKEIVSLVTCSDGSTNDRTVLILIRDKKDAASKETVSEENGTGTKISGSGPKKTGDTQNRSFWIMLIVAVLVFMAGFELVDRRRRRYRE